MITIINVTNPNININSDDNDKLPFFVDELLTADCFNGIFDGGCVNGDFDGIFDGVFDGDIVDLDGDRVNLDGVFVLLDGVFVGMNVGRCVGEDVAWYI